MEAATRRVVYSEVSRTGEHCQDDQNGDDWMDSVAVRH